MAVTELTKLTMIAPKTHQYALLKMLQRMQAVEVEDVFDDDVNQEWLSNFFAGTDATPAEQDEQEIQRLQSAIVFLQQNGPAKKGSQWQRQSIDLAVFEASFQEDEALAKLTQIETLKARWQEMEQAIRKAEEIEAWAMEWQGLDVPMTVEVPESLVFFTGSLENQQWADFSATINQQTDVYLAHIYSDRKKVNFACLYLRRQSAVIAQAVQQFGVQEEVSTDPRSPKKVLVETNRQLAALGKERKQLSAAIGAQKQDIALLQQAEEFYLTKAQRSQMVRRLAANDRIIVLRGWMPVSAQTAAINQVKQSFNDDIYVSFDAPTEAEILANKVPTKLQNKAFIQPFEMLTEMYSLPKYNEIDPTPWMTPFYYVFFGMMVADLGYGLLMVAATTIGLTCLHLPQGTKRFMKLFQTLSVPTMIWGGIYGSFFGATLPIQLLSPSEDFMAIFGIAMVFGGLQLFTGLYLAARENIRKKDLLGAINQGAAWLGLLIGLLVAAGSNFVLVHSGLTTLGLILAGFSGLLIIVVPIIKGPSKVGGLFMGVYDLYGVTGYIGDFVSYSRLMALGISGGSIAAAFNLLVGYLPPAARFSVGILLLIVLQGLNIFLSLLSAYVHAARLQYVEFFGKFFTGGGRRFDPFKPSEKYVDFEKENGGNNDD